LQIGGSFSSRSGNAPDTGASESVCCQIGYGIPVRAESFTGSEFDSLKHGNVLELVALFFPS
jgi:hypothetical protein